MVVVDGMAAITDTVADVTGFIDVSVQYSEVGVKVEMSSQVVKLN